MQLFLLIASFLPPVTPYFIVLASRCGTRLSRVCLSHVSRAPSFPIKKPLPWLFLLCKLSWCGTTEPSNPHVFLYGPLSYTKKQEAGSQVKEKMSIQLLIGEHESDKQTNKDDLIFLPSYYVVSPTGSHHGTSPFTHRSRPHGLRLQPSLPLFCVRSWSGTKERIPCVFFFSSQKDRAIPTVPFFSVLRCTMILQAAFCFSFSLPYISVAVLIFVDPCFILFVLRRTTPPLYARSTEEGKHLP